MTFPFPSNNRSSVCLPGVLWDLLAGLLLSCTNRSTRTCISFSIVSIISMNGGFGSVVGVILMRNFVVGY